MRRTSTGRWPTTNTIVDLSTLTAADVVEVVNGFAGVGHDERGSRSGGDRRPKGDETGIYPAEFTLDGEQFSLLAEGDPVLDTVFGTGPFHTKWDFGGRLLAFPPEGGDYDGDGRADGEGFSCVATVVGRDGHAGKRGRRRLERHGRRGRSRRAARQLRIWRRRASGPAAHGAP